MYITLLIDIDNNPHNKYMVFLPSLLKTVWYRIVWCLAYFKTFV